MDTAGDIGGELEGFPSASPANQQAEGEKAASIVALAEAQEGAAIGMLLRFWGGDWRFEASTASPRLPWPHAE